MKRGLRSFSRALGLALAVGAAAVACVRLDAPSSFVCTSSSECHAGDTCSSGECLSPGECRSAQDCSIMEVCDPSQGRCVAAECWAGHKDVCKGFACVNGACKHACLTDQDCQSPLACRPSVANVGTNDCRPRPKARGQSCMLGDDCGGYSCCGLADSMVCGYCYGYRSPCTESSDCASGHCCPDYIISGIGYEFSCVEACNPMRF